MLNIQHLTKTYGDKKAVDDLSLHIAPGEIYGFIGHNGAGKTTTLKASVGILRFDSGEISVGGISVKDNPVACKKQMAYIPDNPDIYEYMSGIKYLNFIADIFEVGSDLRQERIKKYADMGFQLRNKTSGSQGEGKAQISDYRPHKGYRDGLEQGRKNLAKELSNIADKHLVISLKPEKSGNKVSERQFEKFKELLKMGN